MHECVINYTCTYSIHWQGFITVGFGLKPYLLKNILYTLLYIVQCTFKETCDGYRKKQDPPPTFRPNLFQNATATSLLYRDPETTRSNLSQGPKLKTKFLGEHTCTMYLHTNQGACTCTCFT